MVNITVEFFIKKHTLEKGHAGSYKCMYDVIIESKIWQKVWLEKC